MDRVDVVSRFERLRVYARQKVPSPHQPVALLWALGQEERLHRWAKFRDEVGPLLAEFGTEESSATPEYPFWHLRRTELWEVPDVVPHDGFKPRAGRFNRENPRAGFTEPAFTVLRDPLTRAESIAVLRTYLQDTVDVGALLERVGLAGYDSATGRRRTAVRSVVARDPRVVERVKRVHGDQCQICGIRLETATGAHSEAAHIRGLGRPHEGPDELSNVLCLCPNCHTLFDLLAIYIDPDWTVRRVKDSAAVATLTRRPEHRIDVRHLEYQRILCGVRR